MFRQSKKSSETAALRIRIFWEDTLLEAVELSPPRAFFIGDASESTLPVDYTVPGLRSARVPLVTLEAEGVRVNVPIGALATRRLPEKKKPDPSPWLVAAAPEPVPPIDGDPLLDEQAAVDVRIGALRFSLSLGAPEARCPRALGGAGDLRPFAFFGLSAGFTAALVGAMAYFTPPLGLTDDDSVDRDRMYLLTAYLDAAAEREQKVEQTPFEEKGGGTPNAAVEQGARGESGKMGKRESTAQNRRASGTEPGRETRAATSRAEEIALAQNFGIIGILSSGNAGATPAPWDDPGIGLAAAQGNMFGSEIGEAAGSSGLSLFGMGEGGGDRGDRVGLFSIGTCQGEACSHGIGRFGVGGSPRGPGHTPSGPRLRMAGDTTVSGTLPPEVIQRVVRQSFGRFRSCYEDGLRGNPTLEGRVTARFVIGRDGSVATVQSGGSDLPDSRVVACVLHMYQGLTFPAPKDGIVRVSYPLMFSPSA